jgi:hypothetical protein
VRESRITRVLAAVLCIALLLWSSAVVTSASHVDQALLTLVFFFFAVVRLALLRESNGECTVPLTSFLTVHISRPPPVA